MAYYDNAGQGSIQEPINVSNGKAFPVMQLADGSGVVIDPATGSSGLSLPSHDTKQITYVTSGNGIGEIYQVICKEGGLSGTIVATLTLEYDSSNNLVSVVRS